MKQPFDIARFAGETAIDARLIDGATRDFNLMVRRGAATGDVDVWRGGEPARTLSGDTVLLFCVAGPVEVMPGAGTPVALATNDTLRIDGAQALQCALRGAGTVLTVALAIGDAHRMTRA
ncbi:hypothetical protein LMG29739_01580 [Paraburkholderia solisilvae]|uniref:Quercetin 2,3-dioxygenase C-terminal cupin domain-containing protein n=1 Tax=Paraburkholderia solisilvae TaxID=624376 RepID=A0A6J5DH28_9BURK|nr:hypothetical protein LMG29739_01580 [Paraburkholderia solisilvae]